MWVSDADDYLARPPQKFTIDDSENSDALVATHALSEKDAIMQNQVLRVLFAAFLDVFCETMPSSNRDYVKNELTLMLVKMNIVPGIVLSEEFLSVRKKFAGVVSGVLNNCFLSDPNVDSRISMEKCGALSSRYAVDFEEIEQIGSGGFGTVWKVKCLVDKCFYAIKKIPLSTNNSALTVKLLNEVHLLASLQHENIVRYHSGWLELRHERNRTSSTGSNRPSNSVIITEVDDDDESELDSSELPDHSLTASLENVSVETSNASAELSSDSSSSTNRFGKFWARGKGDNESTPHFSEASSECSNGSVHISAGLIQPVKAVSVTTVQPVQPVHSVLKALFCTDLYIQMELCTSNLEKHLRQRNRKIKELGLSEREFHVDGAFNHELAVQMLSALDFIHQRNVIHRDIKPSNIFMKHYGDHVRFLLGDFGLACEHNQIANEKPNVTSKGVSCLVRHTSGTGTKTYAAPEQLSSSTYGPAVDIFSAGMILFEAYHVFCTGMEKIEAFNKIRSRTSDVELSKYFSTFAQNWPSMATRVFNMTHANPSNRPTASQLVQEFLHMEAKKVDDLNAIIRTQKKQLAAAYKLIQELKEQSRRSQLTK